MGFLKFLFPVCFFWYFLLFGSVDIQHFTIRKQILKNILLLQKLIPQKIVFALHYSPPLGEDGRGLTQLCVFHTRLQQSDWRNTESTEIPLTGLSLDEVWENIVAVIGGLDAQAEDTIEEQIINREQREKLLHQIEALEKRARTEKQTRKKYELHQQIMKLKEQL